LTTGSSSTIRNEPSGSAGYFLTDNLTNKFQYQIPPGYTIRRRLPALSGLTMNRKQNSTNGIDLHVSFALSKSGEAIGLFAAERHADRHRDVRGAKPTTSARAAIPTAARH